MCGLRSENIQKQLLTEDRLDFKRAMELTQDMESAHRNSEVLKEGNEMSPACDNVSSNLNVVAQIQEESEEINWIVRHSRAQGTNGTGRKCYRCGRGGHLAHNCTITARNLDTW